VLPLLCFILLCSASVVKLGADTQMTGQEKLVSSASQRQQHSTRSIDGRQIHALDEAESEALRLKLQRRTASLRSRKAEKVFACDERQQDVKTPTDR
jgi:hypothetical protein